MFSPKKRTDKHKKTDSGQYYFVPREARPGVVASTDSSVRDQDGGGGQVLEAKPNVSDEAFTPKAVNRKVERGSSVTSVEESLSNQQLSHRGRSSSIIKSSGSAADVDGKNKTKASGGQANPLSRALMRVFGGRKEITRKESEDAKKVDPKVFFAAERTFLAWMKASISVAAISIAIGAFDTGDAGGLAAWAGVFFSAVAIGFTIYSLLQCKLRRCHDLTLFGFHSSFVMIPTRSNDVFVGFFLPSFSGPCRRKEVSNDCTTFPWTMGGSERAGSARNPLRSFVAGTILCLHGLVRPPVEEVLALAQTTQQEVDTVPVTSSNAGTHGRFHLSRGLVRTVHTTLHHAHTPEYSNKHTYISKMECDQQ